MLHLIAVKTHQIPHPSALPVFICAGIAGDHMKNARSLADNILAVTITLTLAAHTALATSRDIYWEATPAMQADLAELPRGLRQRVPDLIGLTVVWAEGADGRERPVNVNSEVGCGLFIYDLQLRSAGPIIWAMLKNRLKVMDPVAIRELGLDIVLDDGAWRWMSGQRVSPMLNSNVEQEQIWTKLWDQDMKFYRRAMEDHIIREKVRMILYAAFVGSGGELNFGFWVRHRESMSFEAIRALVVDYDEGLLE